MNRNYLYLPIFLITATCTLEFSQLYTTGDHSYETDVEAECDFGWRGTGNKKLLRE